MITRNSGSTLVRLMTALALIPGVLLMIWLPVLAPVFYLFIVALAVIGLLEYYGMARELHLDVERISGVACCVALVLAAGFSSPAVLAVVFSFCCMAVAFMHIFMRRHRLAGMSATLFGVAYVGWLPAHFILLHRLPGTGPGLVTLLLVGVACSDTGAYFTGRAIGRHRMTPKLSPNKTWEGAAGGVVLAAVSMAVLLYLRNAPGASFPAWPLAWYLLVGVLLSVVGQMGDLVESMMKRDAGVKDSGNIFPGHGGVLDRCDGYLFAGPVLYYLVTGFPV